MSALPPEADIRQRIEHVCFVPIADLRPNSFKGRSYPAIVITVPRHRRMISQKFNRTGRGECLFSPSSGAKGKEPAMSKDEIMEVKYISGIQPFMDEEGETVLAVSWVECPMMKTKHITMRTAASRETAERFCRDLMKLLGIQEQRMVGTTSSDD